MAGNDAPALRTFQFDPGGIGHLENSVNLFRGDVTLTQELVRLAGPPDKPDLDLTLSILYQSNVALDAARSNRDAPTGLLGLGWSLPLDRIELIEGEGVSAATRTYAFVGDGTRNALVREPENPVRFTVQKQDGTGLTAGAAIPAALRARFAEHGLTLDPRAIVEAGSAPETWTIVDEGTEQLFDLAAEETRLVVRDGGEAYQLLDYRFWRILYYPRFERWVIVRESGMVHSYGGGGPGTAAGELRSSTGGSIEWGVLWARAEQPAVALWRGQSTHISGGQATQRQYARCWHLASVSDPWGDSLRYTYNGWERGRDGLLPEGVEQRVGGVSGLPYTKSCYLTRIEDTFGRRLELNYGDKHWADPATDPGGAREYLDPHRGTRASTPNAYQDRYETRFLERVVLRDAQGKPLCTVAFGYDMINVAGYDEGNRLRGDTAKRVLISITQQDGTGVALPAMRLDYHRDPAAAGAPRGALRSITYPAGGTASYSYTRTELDICQRRIQLSPPAPLEAGHAPMPRIWFGSDYAVCTWYDHARGKLSLQVLTWVGRWAPWQLAPASALIFDRPGGLVIETLDVITREEFFALRLSPGATATELYLFTRDAASPDTWVPYRSDDGAETACNQPSLRFDTTTADLTLGAGATFLAALLYGREPGKPATLTRVTSVWHKRRWHKEKEESLPGDVRIVVGSEYLLCLTLAQPGSGARAALSYVDQLGTWHRGVEKDIKELAPDFPGDVQVPRLGGGTVPGFALVAGPGFAVASSLRSLDWAAKVEYGVDLLRWDEHYEFLAPEHHEFNYEIQDGESFSTLPYLPRITGDALVAFGGDVLRFDGNTWQRNSTLLTATEIPTAAQRRFAYGPDYVVQTVYSAWGSSAGVLVFDPNADCDEKWRQRTPIVPQPPVSNPDEDAANWPTAGGADLLTVGRCLYTRGSSTDWRDPLGAPLATLPEHINTKSLIDAAPGFVAYHQGLNGDTRARAVLLRNGTIDKDKNVELGAQRYPDPKASGTAAAGPNAFVTYPATAASLDEAPHLFLYRYAAHELTTPVVEYPVTGLTITDGFGQQYSTCYAYDAATATCDASGDVVKHYRVTTYPGAHSPDQARHGQTVTRYHNGFVGERSHLADGYLEQTEHYDAQGTLLSSSTNTWRIFRERNADPLTLAPVTLRGGFVVQTREETRTDGVASTAETSYLPAGMTAPYSGQPVTTTQTNHGGDGQEETWTTERVYGYAVDAPTRALHILDVVVAVIDRRTGADGITVATSARATTLTRWPARRQELDLSVPGAEASFTLIDAHAASGGAEFPFATYTPGTVPDGWRRDSVVRRRTLHGLVTESLDASRLRSLVITDAAGRLALARFEGAGAGEALYQGFEPSEDRSGWVLSSGAEIAASDAHTGTAALRLPAGATASATVAAAAGAGRYLFGCWYKVPNPKDQRAKAMLQLQVGGVAHGQPVIEPFAPADGDWAHVTVGIPLPQAAVDVRLVLTLTNPGGGVVLIDDVHLHPLAGGFQAQIYDPVTFDVVATVAATGMTTRAVSDAHRRVIAHTTGTEQVAALSHRFFSRQGNAGDRFDPADPSCSVTVRPAGPATIDTFGDGDGWSRRWTATAGNWRVSDGVLWHEAASADTLVPTAAGGAGAKWALAAELVVPTPLAHPVGVTFGAGVGVQWDPASAGWQLQLAGGEAPQALARPPAMGRCWLAVGRGSRLLFYADGQLLFSHDTGVALKAPALVCGADRIGLRSLAWLADPSLRVEFLDGAGRPRQRQRLLGDDALVRHTIYDELGLAVVQTKWAPASHGSGAHQPLLRYRPGFVDVPAFLGTLATTGVMSGDVAAYWSIDSEPGRCDDGGFPYERRRFEPAPQGRIVEHGLPGARYAIRNLHSSTPEDRPTEQYAYAANTGESFGVVTLPAGEYFRQTRISPRKSRGWQLVDRRGATVARVEDATEPALGAKTHTRRSYSPAGSVTTVQLPNRLAGALPPTNSEAFLTRTETDLAGQVRRQSSPDRGTTRSAVDSAGRLRFKDLARDPGTPPAVLYYRYDALGRMVERGTVRFDWTDATDGTLRGHCDDPAWPDPAVEGTPPITPARTYRYDGDGHDPTSIGRLVEVITHNRQGRGEATEVRERFTYQVTGEMRTTSTTVGSSASALVVENDYDPAGRLRALVYPQGYGSPVRRLAYARDDLDRVVSIAVTPAEGTEALTIAYDYDVQDNVIRTRCSLGPAAIETRDTYVSTGWPARRTVAAADGAELVHLSFEYADDRTIKRIVERFTPRGTDGWDATIAYTYDDLQRLVRADASPGADRSMSIERYDPNGNIWLLSAGGQHLAFDHQVGSNRLATVTRDGGSARPVACDAAGRVKAAPHPTDPEATNHFTYDPGLGLIAAVRVEGAQAGPTVESIYDGHGLRVEKIVRDGTTTTSWTTLRAGDASPLLELSSSGERRAYVYGPQGLAATVVAASADTGAHWFAPVCDHLGSVRAVLGLDGTLAEAYDYLPFGTIARARPEAALGSGLRFTGQQFDAETGLYDFHARLYDPMLCRFLAPDPGEQFASAYLYAGDNPLMQVDPTGELSLWAQVGLGVGMAAIAIAGIALTAATFGAAAPGVAAAEGAVATTAVGAETAVAVGAETAAAGAATAAAGSSLTLGSVAGSVAGGAVSGAGFSGLSYDVQHGSDFSWAQFGAAVAGGAAGGAVTGGISAIYAPALGATVAAATSSISNSMLRAGASSMLSATFSAEASAIGSAVGQVVTNKINGDPWDRGVGLAALQGAGIALAKGVYKATPRLEGFVDTVKTMAWETVKNNPKIAAGVGVGLLVGYAAWGFGTKGWE